ncbi:unnamed protein product [Heligmosomoides polygyrus]|uniref:DUF4817 domain-containing protein n=1 Tax=Heligmosomoides polygyrus TaxID=6339 RepID=A0A183G3J3_HELPZ|nr:unnamed protein product [Heligmosomoides polygyrus]
METKMLRWTAGVTSMDRIRSDVIRQKFGVAPTADKVREARLQWKAAKRTPEAALVRYINMDMKVTGVHLDQVQDQERWRHDTRRADPATKRDKG